MAERYTEVEVSSCLFENNKSNDLGGSIFNRGSMTISESTFRKNVGRVSFAIEAVWSTYIMYRPSNLYSFLHFIGWGYRKCK